MQRSGNLIGEGRVVNRGRDHVPDPVCDRSGAPAGSCCNRSSGSLSRWPLPWPNRWGWFSAGPCGGIPAM